MKWITVDFSKWSLPPWALKSWALFLCVPQQFSYFLNYRNDGKMGTTCQVFLNLRCPLAATSIFLCCAQWAWGQFVPKWGKVLWCPCVLGMLAIHRAAFQSIKRWKPHVQRIWWGMCGRSPGNSLCICWGVGRFTDRDLQKAGQKGHDNFVGNKIL